jgi:hypothetical protein
VVLLGTVIGFLLIGACAAVEAAVVATFGHGGIEAGLVLAVFSSGPSRAVSRSATSHGPVGDGAAPRDRHRRPGGGRAVRRRHQPGHTVVGDLCLASRASASPRRSR